MDITTFQGKLAVAMGFSSGENLKFLLAAINFACLDLDGSAKVTRCLFDETWLDAIFGLLVV